MVVEALEEYSLVSTEMAYEDPGGKSVMEFMASGGEYH